ncbi:MAG: roadblock/LC7 domain-containing protein [Polyangiaceae bacterium]|nr:roadblock/LC7 domain-containing protein [Polyangiaceae bacterium]NUQ75280.1 roadblock/LC7 domain-containing protein [Polyangiaceae bacterium]
MSATRIENIRDVLRTLRQASADIIGSAILTSDGFVVASLLPSELDEELVSGMAATLIGVGERISKEMMSSDLEQVYVRSAAGYVIANALTEQEVLVVLTTRQVKLGLIFMELRQRTAELTRLL